MLDIDFDFAKYVAHRKGLVEQRARDGAAYGFAGERKVRRALTSARPVTIAIEATTRLWKASAKGKLMEEAEKATDEKHSRAYLATRRSADVLGIEAPPVYVSRDAGLGALALGTDEDPLLILSQDWIDRLTDAELTSVIGRELGHIQNNQVLYATALHYLQHEAVFFVRWIVRPAVMALQAWARRAAITCDRAALLCAPDFHTAASALLKTEGEEVDVNVDDYLARHSRTRRRRQVRRRVSLPPAAVDSHTRHAAFFRVSLLSQGSRSRSSERAGSEEVDSKVTEILSVFF